MIIVSIPGRRLGPETFEEFRRHVGVDLRFATYEGPETVELPDFSNSLTRMVYQGMARSFLPPPSRRFRVIAAVGVETFKDLDVLTGRFPFAQFLLELERRWDDGVLIVQWSQVILYVPLRTLGDLSPRTLERITRQASSAGAELESAMSGAGVLGGIAAALAGPMYLHFTFLDGEPLLLGPGPRPR